MNVLILTPDRVGSTLLQRLLTVYMLRRGFDKPVINLHELTNGLIKYYHTELHQDVLGKPDGTEWGYYQSLDEIRELLASVDHYKTSRLAHYHLVNRKDSIGDQIKFYDYLNKNFFIIGCRRENVLEHALSWAIQAHSKQLNVYHPRDKVLAFTDIYKDGIEVNQISLTNYLNAYKDYIEWSNKYFNVQEYFFYEQGIENLEKYILNLRFMRGGEKNTWQDMFGQTWDEYNAVHRILPNLVLENDTNADTNITISLESLSRKKYEEIAGSNWPEIKSNYVEIENLPATVQKEITDICYAGNNDLTEPYQLTVNHNTARFLQTNLPLYKGTTAQIKDLVQNGFMVTGIPIKLQSLCEKKKIIKNFSDCVVWYNQWVDQTGIGKRYTDAELLLLSTQEEEKLNAPVKLHLTNQSRDII